MGYFKIHFRGLLLLIGLLLSVSPVSRANSDAIRFSENVNLALRRTVHVLLQAHGDTISKIQPVDQSDASTFSIRMDHALDYGKLPQALQQSLEAYHIARPYTVAIRDCENGKLQLGYQFFDLNQPGGVPCMSRAHNIGCYTLQIRFSPEIPESKQAGNGWLLATFGGTLAALGFVAWNRTRNKKARPDSSRFEKSNPESSDLPEHAPRPSGEIVADARLTFGQSWLDVGNQLLFNSVNTQMLTFREAKLLALFAKNINQVLERETILKSVWEDEGVTVGRSVDVFVSRLRKLLAPDTQIKITAIHGIGYKLEVFS